MPDPAKLLKTLAQAIAAFRATPGRVGRVVTLSDATDVLVVGDLHGHLGNFQAASQARRSRAVIRSGISCCKK